MSVLCDFVANKRVVIVGPSTGLKDSNDGELIDSFDVVCRPNHFWTNDELKNDYGSRTDILFHNFGTDWIPGLKDNIENHKEDFDALKMLVCPLIYGTRIKEDNYMSWPEDHIGDVVHNAKSINTNGIPFQWIGVKKYQRIYHIIGCQPYTGTLSVLMLLECPVKELYVTGFDFYQTDKAYADGLHNPLDGPPSQIGGPHGDMASNKQIFAFKNLLKIHKTLKYDEQLNKIISNSYFL